MFDSIDCFFHWEQAHLKRDIRRLERRLNASYDDDNPCMASDRSMLVVQRRCLERVENLAAHCADLPTALKKCQEWYQAARQTYDQIRLARSEKCTEAWWEARHEFDYLTDLIERLQEEIAETAQA